MKKNVLVGLSVGCSLAVIAVSALALNPNKNFLALAGGLTAQESDRTLTFDKDVQFEKVGSFAGIASIEMMRGLSTNCAQLENGFMRVKSSFNVYYNELDNTLPASIHYYGFGGATVTSVSLSYKVSEACTLKALWSRIKESKSVSYIDDSYNAYTEVALTVSSDIQTVTINGGGFINNQVTAKNNICPSVCLKTTEGLAFDIYSVTINYTCN